MDSLALDRIPRPNPRAPQAGDLLLAAPGMMDPRFHRTVIYLLQHDEDGSAGVIVNRRFDPVVTGISLPDWVADTALVLAGGPVGEDSILALAAVADTPAGAQRAVGRGVCVVDLDELTDVPIPSLRLFVGYAGWGPGQLAGELARHDWLVLGAEPADVLDVDPEDTWRTVLSRQRDVTRLWATMPASLASN